MTSVDTHFHLAQSSPSSSSHPTSSPSHKLPYPSPSSHQPASQDVWDPRSPTEILTPPSTHPGSETTTSGSSPDASNSVDLDLEVTNLREAQAEEQDVTMQFVPGRRTKEESPKLKRARDCLEAEEAEEKREKEKRASKETTPELGMTDVAVNPGTAIGGRRRGTSNVSDADSEKTLLAEGEDDKDASPARRDSMGGKSDTPPTSSEAGAELGNGHKRRKMSGEDEAVKAPVMGLGLGLEQDQQGGEGKKAVPMHQKTPSAASASTAGSGSVETNSTAGSDTPKTVVEMDMDVKPPSGKSVAFDPELLPSALEPIPNRLFLLVASHLPHRSLIRSTHVSRSWRRLLCSHPTFWTDLKLSMHRSHALEKADVYLARSGGCLSSLSVLFNVYPRSYPPSFHHPHGQLVYPDFQVVTDRLYEVLSRLAAAASSAQLSGLTYAAPKGLTHASFAFEGYLSAAVVLQRAYEAVVVALYANAAFAQTDTVRISAQMPVLLAREHFWFLLTMPKKRSGLSHAGPEPKSITNLVHSFVAAPTDHLGEQMLIAMQAGRRPSEGLQYVDPFRDVLSQEQILTYQWATEASDGMGYGPGVGLPFLQGGIVSAAEGGKAVSQMESLALSHVYIHPKTPVPAMPFVTKLELRNMRFDQGTFWRLLKSTGDALESIIVADCIIELVRSDGWQQPVEDVVERARARRREAELVGMQNRTGSAAHGSEMDSMDRLNRLEMSQEEVNRLAQEATSRIYGEAGARLVLPRLTNLCVAGHQTHPFWVGAMDSQTFGCPAVVMPELKSVSIQANRASVTPYCDRRSKALAWERGGRAPEIERYIERNPRFLDKVDIAIAEDEWEDEEVMLDDENEGGEMAMRYHLDIVEGKMDEYGWMENMMVEEATQGAIEKMDKMEDMRRQARARRAPNKKLVAASKGLPVNDMEEFDDEEAWEEEDEDIFLTDDEYDDGWDDSEEDEEFDRVDQDCFMMRRFCGAEPNMPRKFLFRRLRRTRRRGRAPSPDSDPLDCLRLAPHIPPVTSLVTTSAARTIITLDLNSTPIVDLVLYSMLRHIPHLEQLFIAFTYLSDQLVHRLKTLTPCLKEIDARGCRRITVRALAGLVTSSRRSTGFQGGVRKVICDDEETWKEYEDQVAFRWLQFQDVLVDNWIVKERERRDARDVRIEQEAE